MEEIKTHAYAPKRVMNQLRDLLRQMVKDGKKCARFSGFKNVYLVISNEVKGGWIPVKIPEDLRDSVREDVTLTYKRFIPPELLDECEE